LLPVVPVRGGQGDRRPCCGRSAITGRRSW
jgi:hypothetical protein